MLDKILEFIASELKGTAGLHKKIITKKINIVKGINNLGELEIETSKIIEISGSVHYAGLVLPLSYPMINYSNGSYIEWGLAAIMKNKKLQLISGADWENCEVHIVVSYWGGGKTQ